MKQMQDNIMQTQHGMYRAETPLASHPVPFLTAGLSHRNSSVDKPSRKGRRSFRGRRVSAGCSSHTSQKSQIKDKAEYGEGKPQK